MTPEQWAEIERLFHEALELEASTRERFVRDASGDAVVIGRVLAMLRADGEERGVLDSGVPMVPLMEALEQDADQRFLEPGDRVGAFEIERLIATGGMGAVYLAHRAGGDVRQRVAVKLIRRSGPRVGKSADESGRRFRLERQVLASLTHPYITRLIDLGETVDGRPYLVMEYVDGVPIDASCRERGLSPRQVAGLMASVCDAVQHAHQALVQHRDLKPQNILVCADGTPKILDFGIARLLDPKDAWERMNTRSGEFIGTLSYASPEQLKGEGGADTRGDVYSLGSILYHILTGRSPHGDSTNLPSFLAAMEKGQVPPPSDHNAQVSADLSAVVMRAIAAEPERRFQTAAELAADLRRVEAGEPVVARADSRWYVLRSEVRRRRVPISIAGLVVVFSLVFGAVSLWQADRLRDRTSELEHALHTNSIREGRMLSRAGNVSAAEAILWERFHAERSSEDAGGLARWALRELYARYPIEWTDRLALDQFRPIGVDREGSTLALDTRRARVVRVEWPAGGLSAGERVLLQGVEAAGHPGSIAMDAGGEHIAWIDGQGAVWLAAISDEASRRRVGTAGPNESIRVAGNGEAVVLLGAGRAQVLGADGVNRSLESDAVIEALTVDGEGGVFAVTTEGGVLRWEIGTGQETARWTMPIEQGRRVIGVDAEGRRVVCASGDRLAVLDTETGAVRWIDAAQGWIEDACCIDGRSGADLIVAVSADHAIRAWDAETLRPVLEATAHVDRPSRLLRVPGGREVVSIDRGGLYRRWDLGSADETVLRIDGARTVLGIDVRDDEDWLYTALDGTPSRLVIRSLHGSDLVESSGFDDPLGAVVSTGADRCVVATYGGLVAGLERRGHAIATVWEHEIGGPVSSLAASPDGARVAVSHDGGVSLLRAADGERLGRADLDCLRVPKLVWRGASIFAVTLPESRLVELDARSLRVMKIEGGATASSGLRTLDLSDDAQRIACAGDDAIVRVLERSGPGWRPHTMLSGHRSGVFDLAFGPDGLLASGARSGEVILWDLEAGVELARFDALTGMVFDLEFVGERLLVAGADATVRWLGTKKADGRLSRHPSASRFMESVSAPSASGDAQSAEREQGGGSG